MKTTTLKTISDKTGFSVTTISRVLSGKSEQYRISKASAEAILAEAKKCNYPIKNSAPVLRSKDSKTIGLLIPYISNPYFADLSSVIISEFDKNGYSIAVIDTMEDEGKMMRGIKAMMQRKVIGVIVVPCGNYSKEFDTLAKEIPMVALDRYYEQSTVPYVVTNNYQGGFSATSKLIEKGHRRIACIQGVSSSSPNRERVQGYIDAMKSAGLEDEIRVSGNDFSIHNGYVETKLLLSMEQRPSAIFALSGTILLGSIKAVRESGAKIPEDIDYVSFDNNTFLDYLMPSISRINQPIEAMATLAVKILLDRISGENHFNSQIRLSPSFVSGE